MRVSPYQDVAFDALERQAELRQQQPHLVAVARELVVVESSASAHSAATAAAAGALACEIAVDLLGGVATVAHRPDDQRGAAHDVAGGEHAVEAVIIVR